MEDVENIFNMMPLMSINLDEENADGCDKFIIKINNNFILMNIFVI